MNAGFGLSNRRLPIRSAAKARNPPLWIEYIRPIREVSGMHQAKCLIVQSSIGVAQSVVFNEIGSAFAFEFLTSCSREGE